MNVSRLSHTRHTARTPLAARLTALAVTALTSATLAGGALPASALPTPSAHEAPASPLAHARTGQEGTATYEAMHRLASASTFAPTQPRIAAQRPDLLGEAPSSSGLDVRMTNLEPRVITGESDVTVSGTIRNLSATPSVNPSLDFYVQTWTPVTADELHSYLTGETHEGRRIHSATVSAVLAPGASAPFQVTIPRSALPFTDSFEWGPRGITVHADDDHSSGKDRSILIWDSGYALSPTKINVLLPWTAATPRTEGDTSAILAMAGSPGVTFAVDTPTLTSLFGSDTSKPLTVQTSPGNALPWSVATPTASASTGSGTATGTDGTAGGSAESGSSAASTTSGSATASVPATSSSSASPRATSSGTSPEAIAAADAFLTSFFSRTGELVALPAYDADLGLLTLFSQPELAERALASRSLVPTSHTAVRNASYLSSSTTSNASSGGSPSASSSAAASSTPSGGETASAATKGSSQNAGSASSPAVSETNASAPEAAPASSPATASPTPSPATGETTGPALIENVLWPSRETYGRALLKRSQGQIIIAPPGAHATTGDLDFTSLAPVRLSAESGEALTQHDQWESPDTVTALTSLSLLAQLASWDATSSDDELDTQQALTAMTAIITRERPNQSRTLFVPLNRGVSLDTTRQRRVEALVTPRWVQGLSFGEMANSEPSDLAREPAGDAPISQFATETVASLEAPFTSALHVAHATNSGEAAVDTLTASVFNALRTDISDEARTQASASAREWLSAVSTAVKVESSQAVNVINKNADFPVRVRNDLPWPVTVSVTLLPSDPRLQVKRRPEATIPAHSTSTVDVPVSAIGSGDIYVAYRLSTPSGELVDGSQRVLVRMRAGWEDTITAVLAGIFGLAFVAGIVRTIRRRLRARASDEAPASLPGLGGAPRGTVNVPLSNGEHVQAGRARTPHASEDPRGEE